MSDLKDMLGKDAVGPDGDKVGSIEALYVDDYTGEPTWLAVKTGILGTRVSFVPVEGARLDGEVFLLAYDKGRVKGAPHAEPDGHLEPEEEARLYEYYGMSYDTTGVAPAAEPDDAMTRSEEELRVGKVRRPSGLVRLRKWVETERVSTTVPVAHEEVRIEREPITDANVDQALSGQDISEGAYEVTLMEEEAVAGTETVPKERIRLEKETLVEDETVAADLGKERVEAEYDPPAGR